MRGGLVIFRRELASVFYAPIAYVVGVALLTLNGMSFWALMRALSDPALPSQPGAVLRGFFGGTLLHWLVVFAVVSLLSMRSVAEDRRSGVWEATLTTRVRVSTVLLAKWCALLAFYVLLWLPTLALVGILNLYLPAGASMDWGPVLASYLGLFGTGAALLAIGLAFSTATEDQVVAAVGCFSVLLLWLMLGETGVLGKSLSIRTGLEYASRGELRLECAVLLLALISVSLTTALALAAHGRHRVWPGWAAAALVAVIAGSGVSLASRHSRSLDWSAQRMNSLDASTLRVLASLDEAVTLTIVRPSEAVFDPAYDEMQRLLERMQEQQPRVHISEVDVLQAPERAVRWAFELALRVEDLASGGAIIVQQGQRHRSVDLLSLASFSPDDLGLGALSDLLAESALRDAIVEVSRQSREVICSSVGHGELLASDLASGVAMSGPLRVSLSTWSPVAKRLITEGMVLRELQSLEASRLRGCRVVILLGPSVPLSAAEVLSLQRYREAGGNLVIALRSLPAPGDVLPPQSGLGLFLEQAGMQMVRAAVVDPSFRRGLESGWITDSGYGTHAIVDGFYRRRATMWQQPWALKALTSSVSDLVHASERGWGETSREPLYGARHEGALPYQKTSEDSDVRSVALASTEANGARLVLFGSAEAFSAHWSERGIGGNDRLLLSAVHWALARQSLSGPPEKGKRPERLRLIMSEGQLRIAFVWCVLVGPTVLGCVGFFLWWWRRREP